MTPEGAVKKEIKEALKAHGAYFFMPVPTGLGKRTVDFLVCFNGRFLAIEAKAPGKTATALQRKTLREISAAGGIAVTATCWNEVRNFLEDHNAL
jgi:hypothetical protein